MSYTYKYPRPALTVDAMVFRKNAEGWQVLLIKRKNEPFKDKWALPGGFVDMNETLEEAVVRELQEETGLHEIPLKQYHAFSDPNRDPRGRTVSVVFYAFVEGKTNVKGSDDAAEAQWHNLNQLPGLAFDHQQIIRKAIDDLIL